MKNRLNVADLGVCYCALGQAVPLHPPVTSRKGGVCIKDRSLESETSYDPKDTRLRSIPASSRFVRRARGHDELGSHPVSSGPRRKPRGNPVRQLLGGHAWIDAGLP